MRGGWNDNNDNDNNDNNNNNNNNDNNDNNLHCQNSHVSLSVCISVVVNFLEIRFTKLNGTNIIAFSIVSCFP